MDTLRKYHDALNYYEPHRAYLVQAGATLNCEKKYQIRCTPRRPCKRIKTCEACNRRRREYFISVGTAYMFKNDIDTFVTISWLAVDERDCWTRLLNGMHQLAIGKAVKLGKYIRVIAIGGKGTPHVHIVIQKKVKSILRKQAKKTKGAIFHSEGIEDAANLLGYLYDQNFIVLVRHPERPKRIRVLTGSRGVCLGYPSFRQTKEIKNVLALLGQQLELKDNS